MIRGGEPNQSLYLVLSGHFGVHLALDQDPIAELKAGEVAGEVSLISGEVTSAFVVADENSRVLVLDEDTMWSLFDSSPLAGNLLLLISKRLYGADRVIAEQERLKDELEKHAVADALTGFHNRRWLDKMLPRVMQRSRRSGSPFCLILLHIEILEKDRRDFGQTGLEQMLYSVSRKIVDSLRPGEVIVRSGDHDFMVLLPDTDVLTANKVGGRLRRATMDIEFPGREGESPAGAGLTYGVAQMNDQDTSDTLISEAEKDLHEA